MAKVTGSKQYGLVLKPHRPGKAFVVRALALLLVLLGMAGAFWSGRLVEQQKQLLEPGERQQFMTLKEQLTMHQRDGVIDRVAVESSRNAISDLETEVSQLKRAVAFYRGLIAPEENQSGLAIHRFESQPTAEPGRYRLKWVLAQIGQTSGKKKSAPLDGNFSMEFVAFDGEQQVVVALKDLAVTPVNSQFKFQYFQNFEAEVRIPDGLKIDRVQLKADTRGKKPQSVTREFAWQTTEETLANAGE